MILTFKFVLLMFPVLVFTSLSHADDSELDGPSLSLIKKEINRFKASVSEKAKSKTHEELYENSFSKIEDVNSYNQNWNNDRVGKAEFAEGMENGFIQEFRRSIERQRFSGFKRYLSKEVTFSNLRELKNADSRTIDGIILKQVQDFPKSKGQSRFLSTMNEYASRFNKVEFAGFDLVGVDYSGEKSNGRFTAKALLDIRGIGKDGVRANDKSAVYFEGVANASSFVITDVTFQGVSSISLNREPAFQNAKENAGFDSGKVYTRLEALRRGGYAFAVEDFNNDGKLDAFVGSYGESSLWTGKVNGFGFEPLKDSGLESITLAKGAAFVDLDNDGWKDLVISRFSADSFKGDVLVFRNEKGKFKEVKNVFKSDILRDYAMPMALADFNSDGLLDIYVGFPGSLDFSANRPVRTAGTSVHGLFINRGDFKFSDQTNGIQDFGAANVMPHASLASDFNMDGRPDILIMDDQANVGPIYRNEDGGKFTLSQEASQIVNVGFGMGVNSGDFNGDGIFDYVLTNAKFHALDRLNQMTKAKFAEVNGLRMFLGRGDHTFQEVKYNGLTETGEGQGGVAVIDYDNDGLQDLYLVNGLWSGSSRDDKIDTIFAVGKDLRIIHQDHMQDGKGDRYPNGSARSIFMKSLLEARVKKNGKLETLSFAGYQRNRLLKNLGNGEFIDVGYLENVDTISDGYMAVASDIDRDGRTDLLLRNCDPGTKEHMFPVVEVFKNNHFNKRQLEIVLQGDKSNSMGIGAKVYATIGGKKMVREVIGNNSAIQEEVTAKFGMGNADEAEEVVVKWPSGATDTFKRLTAGRHKLVENSKIKLSRR